MTSAFDTPFASSAAPVKNLVTFLAKNLSPEVALGATKAAKDYLDKLVSEAGSNNNNNNNNNSVDERAVAAAALAGAAARATILAEKEEQRVGQLLARALELKLKGISMRMQRFSQIEASFVEKRESLVREYLAKSLEEKK